MGQLPVLEVDGIQVYQSVAMARYVAKVVGLAGKNDWENLLIDIAVDNVLDFRTSKLLSYDSFGIKFHFNSHSYINLKNCFCRNRQCFLGVRRSAQAKENG